MAAKPKSGHTEVKEMLRWFSEEFLPACIRKGGPLEDGTFHVMFAFGTIVRVNPQDIASSKYGGPLLLDESKYPTYRVHPPTEAPRLMEAICREYGNILSRCPPEQVSAIRAAYKILHDKGYPFPDGPGYLSATLLIASKGDGTGEADNNKTRNNKEMSESIGLWGTMFPKLGGLHIISLALEPENKPVPSVDAIGREQRKLDFMMTRAVAVMDSNCKVTHLE